MSTNFDKNYLPNLMEECGEVIQDAAKCMRFGMKDRHLLYKNGIQNDASMFTEIGDILGVLDAAYPNWEKDMHVRNARMIKQEKLKEFGPYGTYLKRKNS